MLAHELRNPLAPIRTGLELLELEPPEEVVQSTRAMIARQLTHLTRLVDDLLDVSRITRGKVVLQKRLLVVEDTLRQIAEGFEPQCLEKGITFRLDLPGETLHISADPTRLEQMVGNLLSNALKFTPRGGFITLAAEAQEDSIAISVTDSGVGIPADQVDQVFDLFSQTERSLDRSLGGLGIGLTVVRALAVLHGGTARISSPGENNGVHAVIRLPRAASEAPAGNEPATDSNPESPLPCRVLIIEDNDDARETLAAYLRLRGCHVEVAGDGHAGLEAAVRSVPEVVICDIGLPGMNGYRIVSTLKLQPQFQRTVFIAVTGYGDIPDRQRSKASGFHAHLTKPASPKDIARLIAAHLSNPARSETAGNG
jgi:CheY-like chemotaxis protein